MASIPFSTISFASTVATQINVSFLSVDPYHCGKLHFISLEGPWGPDCNTLRPYYQARGLTHRMARGQLHSGSNRCPMGVLGKLGEPLGFENLILILSEYKFSIVYHNLHLISSGCQ